MDHMDVDSAASEDQSLPMSGPDPNPSESLSSHRITQSPSKPMSIGGPTSRFKPAPAMPHNHPRSDHKSAFTPFAPTPVSNMYSQKMFKPLSTGSPPNTTRQAAPIPQSLPRVKHAPTSSPLSGISVHPLSRPQGASNSDTKNMVPVHRTPFKPSVPVQIPRTSVQKPVLPSESTTVTARSLGSAVQPLRTPNFSPDVPIPQSLPNIQPSYPATLFGGLSAEDEHVTVWEPLTGKTVAGNAAPYRRNLSQWLECHSGWEEKADELKSSKRRSAARRGRSAAEAFAALCHYPVAAFLANDAAQRLRALGDGDHLTEETMMSWGSDDFVRLQEAIFRLGQECHRYSMNPDKIDVDRWAAVCSQVGGAKLEGTVVSCAHHMLTRGIAKSRKEGASNGLPASFGGVPSPAADAAGIGSPASLNSYEMTLTTAFDVNGPSSLPGLTGASGALLLEKSFRAPREPRVTVWNPSNGRTISGNAAPCKRNLEAWMRQHPGWVPKEEGQLSSSRRNRNRKFRPSSMPSGPSAGPSSVEPESPHFNDALQGLLFLSRSPTAYSPSDADADDTDMAEEDDTTAGQNRCAVNGAGSKKGGIISSVSSSSAEYGNEGEGEEGEDEEVAPKRMEL